MRPAGAVVEAWGREEGLFRPKPVEYRGRDGGKGESRPRFRSFLRLRVPDAGRATAGPPETAGFAVSRWK